MSRLRFLKAALQLWRVKHIQAVLSSLGVIAGVGGLVLVIALGEGAALELESALGSLGSGSVVIRQTGETERGLTSDRLAAVRRLLKNRIDQSAAVRKRQSVFLSSSSRQDDGQVIGTTREYADLFKLRIRDGRFLSDLDLPMSQRVCVLGSEAGKLLFPRGQVIGQEVQVFGDWYRVVGWLQPVTLKMPTLPTFGDLEIDKVIYVPVNAMGVTEQFATFDEFVIRFINESVMLSSLDSMKRIVSKGQGSESLEYVIPIELLRQKQRLQQVFQYVLLGVAALMLAVGGIGIMNMMMVNVISRRSEIGLRRAIGATRSDIITQFVTESSVIAVAGGLVGIVVGLVVSALIDYLSELSMVFNLTAGVVGLFAAVLIGVVFGSYPAIQAASVSPIESLNEL